MKTIVHPSPELQRYNRVLQFINFPISMCFSVENLWITALMISYETPNLIDSFIWILPNIIAILIRPTIITYVHSVISPRQAELALISWFIIGGAAGCFLVGVSAQYFQSAYRIIVCAIGWTVMDVCFQMACFFCEKTLERLKKFGYTQIQQDHNYSSITGQALGYILSFALCYWKGGKTMKKFYSNASLMYWICGGFVLSYWLILYFASSDRFSLSSENNQKNSIIKHRKIGQYLPGYHQLKRATGLDRWLLGLHFTQLYIVDTLLIYGSMWIIWTHEQSGLKQGVAYNLGMKQGALVLVTFTIFSYVNILKLVFAKLSHSTLLRYFQYLLIFICIISSALFMQTGHSYIFGLAACVGMADGLYNNNILPQLIQNNPVFDSTMQLVNRIQKLFILCPMPFFIMIVLSRDDIADCLVCMSILVAALLMLGLIWKDKENIKSKGRVDKVLVSTRKQL